MNCVSNVHTTPLSVITVLTAVKLEEVQELGLKAVCLGLHSDVKAAAVIAMESRICTALSFCLHAPTVDSFVPRYSIWLSWHSLVPRHSGKVQIASFQTWCCFVCTLAVACLVVQWVAC
jgi:hypothetical protein